MTAYYDNWTGNTDCQVTTPRTSGPEGNGSPFAPPIAGEALEHVSRETDVILVLAHLRYCGPQGRHGLIQEFHVPWLIQKLHAPVILFAVNRLPRHAPFLHREHNYDNRDDACDDGDHDWHKEHHVESG